MELSFFKDFWILEWQRKVCGSIPGAMGTEQKWKLKKETAIVTASRRHTGWAWAQRWVPLSRLCSRQTRLEMGKAHGKFLAKDSVFVSLFYVASDDLSLGSSSTSAEGRSQENWVRKYSSQKLGGDPYASVLLWQEEQNTANGTIFSKVCKVPSNNTYCIW